MSLRPSKTVGISVRGETMPASPIRKLVPYADLAKQRGIQIFHLNIGQPDIATPQEMLDAYRNYAEPVLAYGHSAGLPEYRSELATYYKRFDIQIDPEQIIVTTGGSEAILFALMAICEAGDNILVPEPFYTNYLGFAVMAGVEIRAIPTRADEGFHLPPRTFIESHADNKTRALLYSSPGNPTGTVYRREELRMLGDIAVEQGWFLIADEVYREFVYDGEQHTSIFHIEGLEDRAIIIDSVSKRFSACGARIGCLLTRNQEILETCLKFGQARLCPPTVDQIAAQAALQTPPSYLEEVQAEYQQRRNVLVEALQKVPGVSCTQPSGAFYLMAKLPVSDSDDFARWMLEEFNLDGKSVMLAPGAGFYDTPGSGSSEVRIAYVLNSEDLLQAVQVLEAGLAAYPHRT